jgi:hypothetical protein
MKCDCCKAEIAPGDEREHLGKMICEDCYMEALSPMKACDPWAVHSAKTFEEHSTGTGKLTPLQMKILEALKTEGPMEPTELQTKLDINLKFSDLQREFATLRHMEKTRAEKRGDQVVWRLW